jgi:hypothetical protein
MNARTARPDRTLVVVLCVIAALVVVALVVVFSRGAPKLLDAATPAGVVQRYSVAVIDGDEAAAATFLTPAAQADCVRIGATVTDNIRVTLVSTTERAESADVKVSITISSENGPFGVSQTEFEDVFDLVKQNGSWLIDSAPPVLTVCTSAGVTK